VACQSTPVTEPMMPALSAQLVRQLLADKCKPHLLLTIPANGHAADGGSLVKEMDLLEVPWPCTQCMGAAMATYTQSLSQKMLG
jgi:hypothetical protein